MSTAAVAILAALVAALIIGAVEVVARLGGWFA